MTYQEAIAQLNAGKKVSRWVDSFLFHAYPMCEITIVENGVEKQVNASSHLNLPYKAGGCICKKTLTEIEVGWVANKEDIEATGWQII